MAINPQLGVEQLTARLSNDCTNASLGHPILVVGADPRDSQVLVVVLDFLEEVQFGEDAIVRRAIAGYHIITGESKPLESN